MGSLTSFGFTYSSKAQVRCMFVESFTFMVQCDMNIQQPLLSGYHMRHLSLVSKLSVLLLPLLLGHDLLTQRPPSPIQLNQQFRQLKFQFLRLVANLQSQRRFWLVRLEGSKGDVSWSTCWIRCGFVKEFSTYWFNLVFAGPTFLFGVYVVYPNWTTAALHTGQASFASQNSYYQDGQTQD